MTGSWLPVGGVRLAAGLLLLCFLPLAWGEEKAPAQPALSDVQDFVFLGESRPVLIRLRVRIDGKPVQAAWDVFLEHLFGYLDVNGDGSLSKEEAARVPSLDQVLNGGAVGNRGLPGLAGSSGMRWRTFLPSRSKRRVMKCARPFSSRTLSLKFSIPRLSRVTPISFSASSLCCWSVPGSHSKVTSAALSHGR